MSAFNPKSEESQLPPDGLTLLDRELIAVIETLDRRLASLEHDLWVIGTKIEALTLDEREAQ